MSQGGVSTAEPILLHAAGSLRAALGEVCRAFSARSRLEVQPVFGASGLLARRIGQGEPAHVFASADLGHPRALAQAGQAGPVVLFARNGLCAFVRPGLVVTPQTLLARMLDPAIRLGTSTPKADPSGDYAFAVFAKAEASQPGARAALEAKALQLTGGPGRATAPEGVNLYGHLLTSGAADIFLTYRTNAPILAREQPGVTAVALPDELAMGADYGLTVMDAAPEGAFRLALFMLSGDGQAILARHGFEAPALQVP